MKNKPQFFKKIFLSFLLVTLCTSVLLTAFLTLVYNNAIKKNVYKMSQKLLAQSDYSISYITGLADTLSKSLHNNQNVTAFIDMQEWNAMNAKYAQIYLRQILSPLSYVENIYLYNGHNDIFYSTKGGTQLSSDGFPDRFMAEYLTNPETDALNNKTPLIYNTNNIGSAPNVCSFVSFQQSKTDDVINAIVINIKLSELNDSIAAINTVNDKLNIQFLLVDENMNFITASSFLKKNDYYEPLLEQITHNNNNENFDIVLGTDKYFVIHNKMPQNGWTLIGVFEKKELFKDTRLLWVISLFISFLCFFSCAMLSLWIAEKLSRPVVKLTGLFKSEIDTMDSSRPASSDELTVLYSLVSNMKEQNRQFELFQHQTSYTMKQEFLSNLASGDFLYSIDEIEKNLNYLKLGYISNHKLFMCLLIIDDYQSFENARNPRERWASRFAIANIAGEIASANFRCEAFSKGENQFVMLLDAESYQNYKEFIPCAETTIKEIQAKVFEHLNISLSAIYGNFFKGIENISNEFRNLNELMELRLKYGYGCLLNLSMADELEYDSFIPSLPLEERLVSAVRKANAKDAEEAIKQIINNLQPFAYNEILYYISHLSYSINEDIIQINPYIKADVYKCYQSCFFALQNAEILDEIEKYFSEYIKQICNIIEKSQNKVNASQSTVQKIYEMIENDYLDKNLCHSLIASRLEMTPNHLGLVFKNATGKPLSKYIMDYRMEKAGELLRQPQYSVSEVSEMVGLEYSNYFYSCFKKHYGKTVTQYRLDVLGSQTLEHEI